MPLQFRSNGWSTQFKIVWSENFCKNSSLHEKLWAQMKGNGIFSSKAIGLLHLNISGSRHFFNKRHTKLQKKYRHTFIYKSEKKASNFVKVSLQKRWLSRGHVIDVTLVSSGTPVEKHCLSAIFTNIFFYWQPT